MISELIEAGTQVTRSVRRLYKKATSQKIEGKATDNVVISAADEGGWPSLLRDPNETEEQEYKEWLNLNENEGKAKVAEALIAITNYGGGDLIIGWAENAAGHLIQAAVPDNIENDPSYGPDNINGIVRKYCEPSFNCRVNIREHPDTGEKSVIITTPKNFQTPVYAKINGPDILHNPHKLQKYR